MRRLLLFIVSAFTCIAAANAQTTFLQGRVTDDSGNHVSGVSVMVAGTNTGTTTDDAGNYALRLPEGLPQTALIRFSHVGMQSFETRWNGRGTIDATLAEESLQAEEVVVTGIINLKPNEYVGSQTTIKGDSIYQPVFNSLDEMMQGQVPGMAVRMASMRAGATPEITIRGRTTLMGRTTEPLWVVDGIIQPIMPKTTVEYNESFDNLSNDQMNDYIGSAISWLNPQDVETITILKDASATAIYGARASNGVIVVTTKRGTADRLSVRASYNLTVGQQLNYGLYKLMNSQERINFSKEAFEAGVYYQNTPIAQMYTYEGMYNMFLQGRLSEDDFIKQYRFLETVNTDWFDLITRPSINQNASVSATGGNRTVSYVVSASYANQQAAERGNGNERYTGRIALDARLAPTVRISTNIMGSMSETTGFANSGIDPIGYAVSTSRAIPAFNEDGTPAFYQSRDSYKYNSNTVVNGLPYNILEDMRNVGSTVSTPTLQASLDFQWMITPELTFQTVAGYISNSRASESWLGEGSFAVMKDYRGYRIGSAESLDEVNRNAAVLKHGGVLITDHLMSKSYNMRNQLNYTRSLFDGSHRLTAMAMWEISSAKRNSKYNTVFGYDRNRGERVNAPTVPNELVPIGIDAPSDYTDTYLKLQGSSWRSNNVVDNMASAAMIVAYTINERYVLNANFRNDWSNAFGQNANRRFNPAWSVGVSWRLSDEPFMENTYGWLTTANLRLTYGTQGNVGNSATTEAILSYLPVHPIYDEPMSKINRVANPWMTWERTQNWNAGLDLGLFDNRVSLVVDGYTRLSNVGRTYYDTYENGGFPSTLTGTFIRNTGIEGSINLAPVRTERWRVNVSANVAKNWSKIVREDNKEERRYDVYSYINGQSQTTIMPGYPMGAFWAYPYAGPDPEYGIPTFHYFHDGQYTEEEKARRTVDILSYAGSKIPDITGGITLRVSYRNFSLVSHFAASLGGKNFLLNPYSAFLSGRMPEPTSNLNDELLNRWTKDNTGSNMPGLYIVPDEGERKISLVDPTSINGIAIDRYEMWGKSDARIASMTTFRCRSISATWHMNRHNTPMLEKAKIKNVDITASVNNVFLLADSKWQGMDPEFGGDRKMPRSFTFGINFGF